MKTKLILIEGKQIGIVGLEEVFEEFDRAGKTPDKGVKKQLLSRLKADNYIPSAKERTYASAFLEEYEKFLDRKERGGATERQDLGTWRGIPRQEIPWYPTIRDELCDGCNVCLEFCSFGVYEYDHTANKVRVANPFNCEVGCAMCALKCRPNAIAFPPLAILETFRKR